MHCEDKQLLLLLPLLSDEELIRLIRRAEHAQAIELIGILLAELEQRRIQSSEKL